MLPTLGNQRHDLGFGQRLFELNAEAIALDPADNTGKFEILPFEKQPATDWRRRRGAEHRAALRNIKQNPVGLTVYGKEGGRQHDPMPPVTTCIGTGLVADNGHRVVHLRIAVLPIIPSSQIVPNESLKWTSRARFFGNRQSVVRCCL